MNGHHRHERDDDENRECEQAHGRLQLCLIGVDVILVGHVVDRVDARPAGASLVARDCRQGNPVGQGSSLAL